MPLNSVETSDLLAIAIAGALQVSFYNAEPTNLQLAQYLRGRNMLLIMDNFEHLLAGADLLIELLQAAQ